MARGEVKTLYFADGTTVTPPENVPFTNAELDGATVSNYLDFDHVETPLNPPASTLRIYAKSDNSLYAKTTAGVELPIGSGSGTGQVTFLYDDLSNGSASNWVSYDDGSVAVPVDGTGGTPSTLTVTASTSSPLRGMYSLQIAKSAADGRGEGIAAEFTIPNGYLQAAKRNISFLWDGSGANYVAGDIACYVYDVTNATLITPSVAALPAAKVPIQISWDSSSSSSYRLIFHVTTTNAASYNVKLDDITVGPGQIVPVPAIGPWTSYTPVVTNWASSTPLGKWRRVGDTMECQIQVSYLAGVPSGTIEVSIPSGFTVDTSALNNANSRVIGKAICTNESAGLTDVGTVQLLTNTVRFLGDDAAGVWNATVPRTWSATINQLQATFSIPIAEWAGTPNYAGVNDVIFGSDDGSSDVFGPAGTLVPNVGFGTGVTQRTFTVPSTVQATDRAVLEFRPSGYNWQLAADVYPMSKGNNAVAANQYGMQGYWTSETNYTVDFGNQGNQVTISNASNGLQSWSTRNGAGDRYRIRFEKSGAAVGFGAATSTSMGLLQPPTNIEDVKATQMGLKAYAHGTNYNGGIAPTITLSSGGGTLSAVNNSVFIPYQMQSGSWRLKGSFSTTVSSAVRTTAIFAVNGITFIGDSQPIFASPSPGNDIQRMRTISSTNTMEVVHVSGTTTTYYFGFDVDLTAKPTWAY